MDNIAINSESYGTHLISSTVDLNLSNETFDVVGELVASSSNHSLNFDLSIEGMDVSNSVPIIDMLVSPISDLCINLVGEHYVDPVDHFDLMEGFLGKIRCCGDFMLPILKCL